MSTWSWTSPSKETFRLIFTLKRHGFFTPSWYVDSLSFYSLSCLFPPHYTRGVWFALLFNTQLLPPTLLFIFSIPFLRRIWAGCIIIMIIIIVLILAFVQGKTHPVGTVAREVTQFKLLQEYINSMSHWKTNIYNSSTLFLLHYFSTNVV